MKARIFRTRSIPLCIVALAAFGASLNACVPMGLPEYFSSGFEVSLESDMAERTTDGGSGALRYLEEQVEMRRKKCLLVVGDGQRFWSWSGAKGYSLGHQYLFGVIPFTSLYLQHSVDSLLFETLIDGLEELDCKVYLVGEKNLSLAYALLKPQAVLTARLNALAVNAYDALFFRVVRITGELEFSLLAQASSGKLVPERKIFSRLSERKIRKYGLAPILSLLLKRALKAAEKRGLAELFSYPFMRYEGGGGVEDVGRGVPLVILFRPRFAKPLPKGFGSWLFSSYGFSELPSPSGGALLRLIQRGEARGLDEMGIGFVSAVSEHSSDSARKFLSSSSWGIYTDVFELASEANDMHPPGVRLELGFRLTENAEGGDNEVLGAQCEVVEPPARSSDGALVVSLERAASKLVAGFLQTFSDSGEKISCAFK